jgi:hypothetical protein
VGGKGKHADQGETLKLILKFILLALIANIEFHGQEVNLKDTRLLNLQIKE